MRKSAATTASRPGDRKGRDGAIRSWGLFSKGCLMGMDHKGAGATQKTMEEAESEWGKHTLPTFQ